VLLLFKRRCTLEGRVCRMTHIPSSLGYIQGGRCQPLPTWCTQYIEFGMQITQTERGKIRSIVALAIPMRAYASMFVALGIVLANSNKSQISEEYFQFIVSQPIGTSVVYQTKHRKLRGVIERFYDKDGQIHICISTGKRESIQFPLKENVSKLLIAERDFRLPNYQKGSKVELETDFIKACIQEPRSFVTQTQLDCLIVTQLSLFRIEATETILALEDGKNILQGKPQDILRAEQLLGANEAYRCQILPVSTETDLDIPLEIQNPPIVIFDGSNAYLRHHPKWLMSHQIVVLDRTERAFQDAVDSVNQRYTRRAESKHGKLNFDLPYGVEAIVFQDEI
jgi:hypothetical protein